MEFEWEEIYNNSKIKSCAYFEATYRAQVIGGWLIRHETCCDYQYEYLPSLAKENAQLLKDIHDEGFQDIKNTICFISDPQHKWGTDKFDGVI